MDKEAETKKKAVLRAELRERTTGYILTALGLVAGLAWNDAISSFIKFVFPLDGNGIIAKFIYAVIITVVIVFVSNSLLRVLTPKEKV
jgi:hypothetical protein